MPKECTNCEQLRDLANALIHGYRHLLEANDDSGKQLLPPLFARGLAAMARDAEKKFNELDPEQNEQLPRQKAVAPKGAGLD